MWISLIVLVSPAADMVEHCLISHSISAVLSGGSLLGWSCCVSGVMEVERLHLERTGFPVRDFALLSLVFSPSCLKNSLLKKTKYSK